ncbi:uncharacterized protein LOC142336938 [Convolutriloba macropyga]|uniref:uncharacterized protein LOC142336938 n=1 Tax=Convolutriloba macropyga TaxID=536237 RepID=UPI003F522C7E
MPGCNESLFIFNTSVVGGCYLQIAISWLEVTWNSKQIVVTTNQKKVLGIYLLISFVELIVSIMTNYHPQIEPDPHCNFMLMRRANAYLVVKEFELLLLGAAIFLFSSLRAPWKLWHMNRHRVYFMVVPGVVDLRTHFRMLIRESIIGFVVCSAFTTRIYLFSLKRETTESVNQTDNVLTTFIWQFIAVSFYRF